MSIAVHALAMENKEMNTAVKAVRVKECRQNAFGGSANVGDMVTFVELIYPLHS